jgi:integrase
MARRISKRLTSRTVDTAPPGKHADGEGLYLVVAPGGARKWVFRYMRDGRAREMGLGKATGAGLADARRKTAEARAKLMDGLDPLSEKAKTAGVPTFGELADEVRKSLSAGFRNEKHRAQWKSTLETYAAPIRALRVDAVDTADVLTCLRPIWTAKPETASRVRGRIEKILDAAKAKGFRIGENPARWRGHLDHLLPKQSKLSRGHHGALPYSAIPTFLANLRERQGISVLALEFTILTAARSGEVMGALWSEIDISAKVWTVPSHRMKAGREHRVPISARSLQILADMEVVRNGDYVFPGSKPKQPLSVMALEMALRRVGKQGSTVHGFRSSFRDWAGNETSFPRELAEQALAHVIGDQAEQAYRRGDALERRRELMEAWARYIEPNAVGNVVEQRGSQSGKG